MFLRLKNWFFSLSSFKALLLASFFFFLFALAFLFNITLNILSNWLFFKIIFFGFLLLYLFFGFLWSIILVCRLNLDPILGDLALPGRQCGQFGGYLILVLAIVSTLLFFHFILHLLLSLTACLARFFKISSSFFNSFWLLLLGSFLGLTPASLFFFTFYHLHRLAEWLVLPSLVILLVIVKFTEGFLLLAGPSLGLFWIFSRPQPTLTSLLQSGRDCIIKRYQIIVLIIAIILILMILCRWLLNQQLIFIFS